ncbi:DNA polymerase [uncultured archaeon]|nr:DNA polymerase [uncultured archaeon]
MDKVKALLIDVSYEDDENNSVLKIFVKDKNEGCWVYDNSFHPYFYAIFYDEKEIEKIRGMKFGEEKFSVLEIKETKMTAQGKKAHKVVFRKVSHLVQARKDFHDIGIKRFEYDVPFSKRYLFDNALEPGNFVEMEIEEVKTPKGKLYETKKGALRREIKSINKIDGDFFENAVVGAFDLETWSGKKFEVGAEPILMASVVSDNEKKVYSYETKKVKGMEMLADEKELVDTVTKKINEFDFIVTYNGDNFDFPYMKKRADKLKTKFLINGEEIRVKRHGLDNAVELEGKQHIDAYQIMKLLQRTGSVNTVKLDLESVSEKVFGVYKEKVFPSEINDAWKSGDAKKLTRLVDYNLKDSEVTYKIAKDFLPLFIEISKLTSQTLADTTRATTSQMVEDLLMKEAHLRCVIAPNKPHEGDVKTRTENPIKGAFVKEPMAGLHEQIAVLDFASLYPSIIISHNISPETLNCSHAECKKNVSSDGTYFCTKEKGLFPEIIERMLKQRLKLKAEYKKKKKEKGTDDKILFAKQWALKIILNSVYGYLGYARARWYSRECASAVTAWARGYIQETIKHAEKEGFKVLYGDTDSTFLLMNKKTKKEVEEFAEKVNKTLPDTMELEIDGFYKRGLFVTKREGGAAKKRYALIDEKGNLKIVGFEYVRRDWCNAAKETQKKVIELVLSQGNPEEAVKFVRKTIEELKSGAMPKKELAIMTLLQREPKDYDSIGPHVAAAEKAIARGKQLGVGSMLSFIITKGNEKASISDKAELEEFVEEGNYDANYYIENQVLPAVIRIMQELGYSREDLLQGGKQTGLSAWG